MRCSASPTICTAPEAPKKLAAEVMEALVFAQVLAPLVARLGPVAELTLGSITRRLFLPR